MLLGKCRWIPACLGVLHFLPNSVQAEALLTDHIFSTSSFWYQPIPEDAPLNPNSANYVAEFLRQKKSYYGNVNINVSEYSSPVFIADAIPGVTVSEWDCQKKAFKDKQLAEEWAAVPIPDYAVPSKGSDHEMTIYQPSTDTIWEFWQAKKIDGQWQACWGGRMQRASVNIGVFDKHHGTTATSLPFLGGQITAEELARGEIRHAIGIALVDAEHFNIFSWPAARSDGFNPTKAPNRIPEGLRFRLDPQVDVESLKMSKAGKVIARAAQKYGFIVWDKAGAISIRAQNSVSYLALNRPNPYPGLFNYKASNAVLDGFPWDKLQFLPVDYGKP